jgi:bifunctional DNase/RNase
MIQMELARIIISETTEEQVIVLREVEGSRAFPIVIGIWEALSIDRSIKGRKTPRPMTHDLIGGVINGLQANLERVVITELRDRTFFANLILRRNGELVEIDSRPSDAIALAVLLKVPIYVAERVLLDAGAAAQVPPEAAEAEEEPREEQDPEEDAEEEGLV